MRNAVLLIAILTAGVAVGPRSDVMAQAGGAEKAKSEPTQATQDLLKKAKLVLQAYYDARLDALSKRQQFNADDAWNEAAKKGDFKDRREFDTKVAEQRKTDPDHFPKLYDEAKAVIEKDHRERLAKAVGPAK